MNETGLDTAISDDAIIVGADAPAAIIDRGKDADTIRDLILGVKQQLIVLYGKSRSGKSEFIRKWVIPRLRASSSGMNVVYGRCRPDLPTELQSEQGTMSLDEALSQPSIIVVDSFDRFLDKPREERREILDRAFKRLEREGQRAKVVLVTDSRQLTNAYSLSAYDPDLIGAVFEIPAVTLPQGLLNLSRKRGAEGITYSDDALEELGNEARAFAESGWDVSFDFIKLLDRRFHSYAGESGKQNIDRTELKKLGGVAGILREHLAARIERSPFDTLDKREVLQLVLESVVEAHAQGSLWSPKSVMARLGVSQETIDAVLLWLTSENGVLLRVGESDFELSPTQLAAVVLEEVESRRPTVDRVRRLVDEGVRSWEHLGSLLSLHRFSEIHLARRFLVLDEASVRFLLLCALHHDVAESEDASVYWLGRISDRLDAMDILLGALFDDDARVRARAAGLLRDFPENEVWERLVVVALVDTEASVRARAVSSLGAMRNDTVQERLLREVKDPQSAHRAEAIDALAAFPSPEIAAVLQDLVSDPATELPLRDRAIRVLATLDISESVDALVRIALKDRDEVDRSAAAAALAVTRSEVLGRRILSQLGGFRRIRRVWLFVAASVWLVVAAILLVAMTETASEEAVGLIVVLGPLLAIPTGWLLRRVRDGRIARTSGRGILTGVLFAFCAATSFYLFHGLAHLLIGRWRRALVLMALEGVSALLINAGATLTEAMNGAFSTFYIAAGLLLFMATYVYDVGAVLAQTLFLTDKSQLMRRKAVVYQQVLGNAVTARLAFDDLASTDHQTVTDANTLLKEFASYAQPDQLLDYVQSQDRPKLKMAAGALRMSKVDETVRKLEGLWKSADHRLRSVINGILCGRPTQGSLQALGRLRKDMTRWMRVRFGVARWNFRLTVWPTWVLVLVVASLPAVVYFLYNGYRSSQNPAWSQIITLRRSLHRAPLTDALGLAGPRESDDRMSRLISFLADNHASLAADEFRMHLAKGDVESRHIRAALAGGLLVIAATPSYEMPAEKLAQVSHPDTSVFEALFLGDSASMPAALERLGRSAQHADSSVARTGVALLSQVIRARVPEPDSGWTLDAAGEAEFVPDSVRSPLSVQETDSLYRERANGWKVLAVQAISSAPYNIALPALDSLLLERSNGALASELRDAIEYVTDRAYGVAKRSRRPAEEIRNLLTRLGTLQTKPASIASIKHFADSLASRRDVALRAVKQDPMAEDGYRHALELYDQEQNYEQAATLFTELKSTYPRSIWPGKLLSELHHDRLAVTDPASFRESFDELRELRATQQYQELRTKDSLTYYRIEADYDETALSAREFDEVERLGTDLTVPTRLPLYRFNAALFVYFARVINHDATGAAAALAQLERITNGLPPDYYNNWSYPGTKVFIRNSGLPPRLSAALLEWCREGDWFTKAELQLVIRKNRDALPLARGQALRPS